MESWNDFLKPFEKSKINDIVPYGKGYDGTYVFVKMTPARAKAIIYQGLAQTVSPIPLVESRKRDFKCFLTTEDAKREKRGECHARYLGDTITITWRTLRLGVWSGNTVSRKLSEVTAYFRAVYSFMSGTLCFRSNNINID
jgi:hypothetical protein